MQEPTQDSVRRVENLHVLLWLLKDISWLMTWRVLGLCMIFPTLLVACYIAYQTRMQKHQFWFNLAIICWISANSTWMIGEFFLNDSLRPLAAVFFALGFSALFYYYGFISRKI